MSSLPDIHFANLFEQDHIGQKLWSYYLGESTYKKFLPRYKAMGLNAAQATSLSRLADRNPPQLKSNSSSESEPIVYHDSYRELQKLSYGAEIISLKYDKKFLEEHSAQRHLIGFSIAYYFAQTETGLFCPICMTDALARVIEKMQTPSPEAEETLKHLTTSNLENLWQGAMFLTEKQGGSDVGANRVQAEHENGKWILRGEKWFCSNADAEASLVLARMPKFEGKEIEGTKGLGLFLLLRNKPAQNFKNWSYKRLKDKLGVKSMASAEIDFNGAEAFLIGGAGEGFKMMTDMVNMSRIYNSIASIAIARRAFLEAIEFGKQREAFGKKLIDLPLWRASMADLSAEVFAMQVFVFEAIRQMDLQEQGSAEAAQLLRMMTPIAKAMSGKLAVFASREGMELIGGNAFIEDHIMPRLLRDASVLPIWEGTTNIQALDLMRSFRKETLIAVMARIDRALKTPGTDEELQPLFEKRIKEFKVYLAPKMALPPADLERQSLEIMNQLNRILSLTFLFEMSADNHLKTFVSAAFLRIIGRSEAFQSLGLTHSFKTDNEVELLKV